MFNQDFYPTPKNVIQLMTHDLDLFGKFTLEPSAGKGDILDHLTESGSKTLACERHPELAKIAQSKCDHFIGNDFLLVTREQVSHIDYIIMNPPFSADEKHILHAWEIAPEGCVIKALCNWETIDNHRHSMNRAQLIGVIKDHGNSENLGNVFSTAERKTDAHIGLVTLFKPKTGEDEFKGFFDLSEDYEEQQNGLIQHNEMREIVNRYVGAVKMFDKVQSISDDLNVLAAPFGSHSDIRFGAYTNQGNNYQTITRETYKKDLQKAAWKTVFSKLKMEKYVTESVKEKLNKFIEKQTNVPFKLANVYAMVDMIVQTYGQNMDNAIIELFDRLTKHYHENRYSVEGWKTNSHYLINKKFIMPYMTDASWNGHLHIRHNSNAEIIDDMVKALCYLTGSSYDNIGTLWNFINNTHSPKESWKNSWRPEYVKRDWGTWYDWGFFRVKGFKKGTMHLEFKDEKVWASLNQRIAKIKGWGLPESFLRKTE